MSAHRTCATEAADGACAPCHPSAKSTPEPTHARQQDRKQLWQRHPHPALTDSTADPDRDPTRPDCQATARHARVHRLEDTTVFAAQNDRRRGVCGGTGAHPASHGPNPSRTISRQTACGNQPCCGRSRDSFSRGWQRRWLAGSTKALSQVLPHSDGLWVKTCLSSRIRNHDGDLRGSTPGFHQTAGGLDPAARCRRAVTPHWLCHAVQGQIAEVSGSLVAGHFNCGRHEVTLSSPAASKKSFGITSIKPLSPAGQRGFHRERHAD